MRNQQALRRLAVSTLLFLVAVAFSLHCKDDITSPSNEPPTVTEIVLSQAVAGVGRPIILTAVATDPDGDAISYVWSSSSGSFLHGTQGKSVEWTAPPQPGECVITVSASDGKATAKSSKSIAVVSVATVQGYVWYTGTKIAIDGVVVRLDTAITFTTSGDGHYRFSDIPVGRHTLSANRDLFTPFSKEIVVTGDTVGENIGMTSSALVFSIGGVVTNNYGQSLVGVRAGLLNPDSTESDLATTTDATGSYKIPTVPQGQRVLQFLDPLFVERRATVFLYNTDLRYDVKLTARGIDGPVLSSVIAMSSGRVRLTWGRISRQTMAGYNIYATDLGMMLRTRMNALLIHRDSIAYTAERLKPRTAYEFEVTCVNYDSLEGAPSNKMQVTTLDVLGTPQNVRVLPFSGKRLRITWDPIVNEAINGYNVYRDISPSSQRPTRANVTIVSKDSVGFTDIGVSPADSSYFYSVTSVDQDGNESPRSWEVRSEFFRVTLPRFLMIEKASRRIRLTWEETDPPLAKGYYVLRNDVKISPLLSLAAKTFTDTSLTYGAFYTYQLEYEDEDGFLGKGDPYNVQTEAIQAVLTGVTGIGPRTIRLTWDKSNPFLKGFLVWRREGSTVTQVAPSPLTADSVGYTDSGLVPRTYYEYQIAAVDIDEMQGLATDFTSARSAYTREIWGEEVNLNIYAGGGLLVDLNSDGKLDILWVRGAFRNTGTRTNPSFSVDNALVSGLPGANWYAPVGSDLFVISPGDTLKGFRKSSGTWTEDASVLSGLHIDVITSRNTVGASADLDSDGDHDLAIVISGSVYFYENVGNDNYPTWSTRWGRIAGSLVSGLSFGDLTRDGKIDLLLCTQTRNKFGTYFEFFENTGDPTFPLWTSRQEYTSGYLLTSRSASEASLGDLDGDGDLDLFYGGRSFFRNGDILP